jgi:hypothetical protein
VLLGVDCFSDLLSLNGRSERRVHGWWFFFAYGILLLLDTREIFFFLSDGWFTHHLFGGGRDYMRDFIWDYVWVDSSPGIGSNVMKSIEFVMW